MPASNHEEFLRRFLGEERLLRAFLYSATGSAEAAEDLLQTVATTLWAKWDEFDAGRPFRPWALGMARLEVLKWRQRLARSKEVLSEEAVALLAETTAEVAPEADVRQRFLAECLKALKGVPRLAMELKYGEELRIAEIAERLGRSVGAVEMMLVRSRRALRDCMERRAAGAAGEMP